MRLGMGERVLDSRGNVQRQFRIKLARLVERFAPFIELYREAAGQFGTTAHPVGMHSPGFVADTDEQARTELWPNLKTMYDRIGAERGWSPMTRADFDREADRGSLYVGSPQTVARKIAFCSRVP